MTPAVQPAPRRATVLAVTSGKGGVGKTNVAVNVAMALARLGYRVGVLDADFGLGNVDVLLGLTPACHVGHVLSGEKALSEVMVSGPRGVQIVPASSGLQALTALSPHQRQRLRDTIADLRHGLDFLLIDTASGVSDIVIDTLAQADRVMVLTSLEPSAVVDAYAVIKILSAAAPMVPVGLAVNGARSAAEAGLAVRQLQMAAGRFLGRQLSYYGFVPDDPAVRDAVLVQRAIVDHLPQSPASRCYRLLACRVAGVGPQLPGMPAAPLRRVEGIAAVGAAPANRTEVQRCA